MSTNIRSSLNRSIADIASKIMSETPAKVEDHKPKQELSKNLVDSVIASGVSSRFTKLHEESSEDTGGHAPHVDAETKLDHKPVWPKPAKDSPWKTKTSGEVKEDWHEGLQQDYAAKLPTPRQLKWVKKTTSVKESFSSAEIVDYLQETTGDNKWYVNTKLVGAPVGHRYFQPSAVQRLVTQAVREMKSVVNYAIQEGHLPLLPAQKKVADKVAAISKHQKTLATPAQAGTLQAARKRAYIEKHGSGDTPKVNEAKIPLAGHPYHGKSDAELHYIIRDAGEAASAMRGHNDQAESKYLDQVNDAVTVLHHRRMHGVTVKPYNEEVENIDEVKWPPFEKYSHRAWFKPRDGRGSHFGIPFHYTDTHAQIHKRLQKHVGEKLASHYEMYKVEPHSVELSFPYKTNEEAGNIEEVAPPGQEDFIKTAKPEFKKRYGKDWKKALYSTAWKRANEDVENVEEASASYSRGESPTLGTRLVAAYGGEYHRAEVRKHSDTGEYQVHHYRNGKHMGEGPVSYHYDDSEDAHNTAKYEAEKHNKKLGEEAEQVTEKNWIAGAIKKKGALRKALHVPAGEDIPASKLEKAEHAKGKLGRRARLAATLKGLRHKKK